MGLGTQTVDAKYGRFVVTQLVDKNDAVEEQELETKLCSETSFFEHFEDLENPESLYCLQSYDDYQIKGNDPSSGLYTLKVSFELCQGVPGPG